MEVDIAKLKILLREGLIVPKNKIASVIMAVKKKNKGGKMTPKAMEIYNNVAENIFVAMLTNKPVTAMVKQALKKQNKEPTNQAIV